MRHIVLLPTWLGIYFCFLIQVQHNEQEMLVVRPRYYWSFRAEIGEYSLGSSLCGGYEIICLSVLGFLIRGAKTFQFGFLGGKWDGVIPTWSGKTKTWIFDSNTLSKLCFPGSYRVGQPGQATSSA